MLVRLQLRSSLHGGPHPAGRARVQPRSIPPLKQLVVEGRRSIGTSSTVYRPDSAATVFNKALTDTNLWKKQLNLPDLLEDLRQLQAIARLKGLPGAPIARDYKLAERALFPILERKAAKQSIQLEDLRELVPKGDNRAWRVITEKARTGQIEQLQQLDEKTRTLALFGRVGNIGSKIAIKLYNAGLTSFAGLQAEASKDVQESLLTHAQQIGVKHFHDLEKLIPRAEVDAWGDAFKKALAATDSKFDGEILGSYRRGDPWSSDVDFVIRHKDYDVEDLDVSRALLKQVLEVTLQDCKPLDKPLMSGDKKCHTIARLPGHKTPRRIDVRIADNQSYHYMLLGCTGDLELMKYLRNTAIDKGLHLNEYGMGKRVTGEERGMQKGADIWDAKQRIIVNSEEEIFKALGLPYVPPTERSYNKWRRVLPTRKW